LHYYLNGELLRTATPRSWAVDEPFRGHAPLLADSFFRQPNVDLLLSTTGNDKSIPVFTALGGIFVPQRITKEAVFWITDYTGFSEAYLRLKNAPRNQVLSYSLGAALGFKDALTKAAPLTRDAQRAVRFEAGYDDFWRELQKSSKFLIGRRDAAAINWHFGDALGDGSAWLFEVRQGSRIKAYGVFLRHDHPRIGLKRMVLADYQQLEDGDSSLRSILGAALLEARLQRIHVVEIPGSRLGQSQPVKKLAAHRRVKSEQSMTYQYKASAQWEQVLARESIWDLTFFDGDSSLSPQLLGETVCC
jgi:hypothetical protein